MPQELRARDTRSLAELDQALFLDSPSAPEKAQRLHTCESGGMPCLLGLRFARDPLARKVSEALWEQFESPAGVAQAHTMDGGYRGWIRIAPRVPEHAYRIHIERVARAFTTIDLFLRALRTAAGKSGAFPAYRARAIDLRFFESLGRTTPSATALDWTISYNVRGSLLRSDTGALETLVHEIFHLNDQAHRDFSAQMLTPLFEAVRTKCGDRTSCLTPYAPGTTMVRGGTFYAFQPGNDVREYAAELAVRYFTEHQAALAHHAPPNGAFKCGPTENSQAWGLFVHEFMDDVDLVHCP
jgi:hypothetical protein